MFQVEKDKLETVGFTSLISTFQDSRSKSKDPVVLSEVQNSKGSKDCVLETQKKGLFTRPKVDPQQAADAIKLIKQSMDQQLGAGTSDQIFQQADLQDKSVLNFGDLEKLGAEYDSHLEQLQKNLSNPERATAQKWQQAAAVPAQALQKPALDPLHNLLTDEDVSWSIAESGSGGALLGRKDDGTGVVVKIEGLAGVQKAAGLSMILDTGLPGTYDVARVTNETDAPGIKAGLLGKLDELRDSVGTSEKARKKIDTHIANLESNEIGISSMEMVSGKQLNKLPLDDKMALLQTGQLAHEIGKAAVLCPAAGLSDHASASSDYNLLPTNLSNFLVNERTGQLNPIDFDAREMNNGKFGVQNTHKAVEEMSKLATFATSSQANFDRVMNGMAADFKQGGGQRTALGGAFGALAPNSNCEGLFSSPERDAVAPLMTDDLVKIQAVNMLQGMIGGLEQLHQNAQNLKQAVDSSVNIGSSEEIDQALQSLNNLDFNALRQNVASLAEGRGLAVEPNTQISPPSNASNSLDTGLNISSSSNSVPNVAAPGPTRASREALEASKGRRKAERMESGQYLPVANMATPANSSDLQPGAGGHHFGIKESELGDLSIEDLQSELERLNTGFEDSPQRQAVVTTVTRTLDAKLNAAQISQPSAVDPGSVRATWNATPAPRTQRQPVFQLGAKSSATPANASGSIPTGESSSSNSVPLNSGRPVQRLLTPAPAEVASTAPGSKKLLKDDLPVQIQSPAPVNQTKASANVTRKPGS